MSGRSVQLMVTLVGIGAVLALDIAVGVMGRATKSDEVRKARNTVENLGNIPKELESKTSGDWVVMPTGKTKFGFPEFLVLEESEAQRRFQECKEKHSDRDRSTSRVLGKNTTGMSEFLGETCQQYARRNDVLATYEKSRAVLASDSADGMMRFSLSLVAAVIALILLIVSSPPIDTDAQAVSGMAKLLAGVAFVAAVVVGLMIALIPKNHSSEVVALAFTAILLVATGVRRLKLALSSRAATPGAN
ncbi:MAG: hypothetical protein IAE78_32675 [Myxococcus sp.]|nr:hypothetical protein [Myxococcus sp.]